MVGFVQIDFRVEPVHSKGRSASQQLLFSERHLVTHAMVDKRSRLNELLVDIVEHRGIVGVVEHLHI